MVSILQELNTTNTFKWPLQEISSLFKSMIIHPTQRTLLSNLSLVSTVYNLKSSYGNALLANNWMYLHVLSSSTLLKMEEKQNFLCTWEFRKTQYQHYNTGQHIRWWQISHCSVTHVVKWLYYQIRLHHAHLTWTEVLPVSLGLNQELITIGNVSRAVAF